MSPSTVVRAPTQRQLRYLRALAVKTGTTFAYPRSSREASAQIVRLRKLEHEPRAPRTEVDHNDCEHLLYATAVHDSEVTGFGSSATWRTGSRPAPRAPMPKIPTAGRRELARYRVSGGERVLVAELSDGRLIVTDTPASGGGRSYLIESDVQLDGDGALEALIADYTAQAHELDEIPMANGVVRQLHALAGSDV